MTQAFSGALHPLYVKLLPRYRIIRDCLNDDVVSGSYTCYSSSGSNITIQHLVRTPGMSDDTYNALKQLGRFLNVTGSTLEMLMGAAWKTPPTLDLPNQILYLEGNADGEGNSLNDLIKDALADTVSMGRFGLLAEPASQMLDDDGNIIERSKSDNANGIGSAHLKPYAAEAIIDYDVSVVNGRKMLSLVKLEEVISVRNTATYQTECETRYRFLILDNEGYHQQVFKDADGTDPTSEKITVTDYNGRPMDHIPFFFSGSRNNDPTPDNPPFYKIADRNIAHYNNDANNRLNILLYATGTLFVTGDNQKLGEQDLTVGGGNGFYLGKVGSASLLQLDAGSALPEALKADLEDMILLGAKLSNPSVQRTAEEAKITAAQETALLSDVVGNVESMFRDAVNEINVMMTGREDDFTLDLSKQFFTEQLTFQERAQWMSEYQGGIATFESLFNAYKKAGLIPHDKDITVYRAELESDGQGMGGF